MGRGQRRLHRRAPRVPWVRCYDGRRGLGEQTGTFHPHSHHCHGSGLCPALPPTRLEATWPSEVDAVRSRTSVRRRVHLRTVSSIGHHDLILDRLSSTVGWSDRTCQPGTRTVHSSFCERTTERLGYTATPRGIRVQ